MSLWNSYHTPHSVEDALRLMQTYGESAKLVAGGTDLLIEMQQGTQSPVDALVDITRIPDLTTITGEDGWVVLGAAVTHAQIERSELIRQHGTALCESCGVVGGPQVRNVATIGGNVAHALPAADGALGLLALNAEVKVCTLSDDGLTCDWHPLQTIYAGPGMNRLDANQLIGAFRFPRASQRQASAFDRVMRPQGVALPILGVAAKLTFEEESYHVRAASIAIGPAGPTPFRATDAEAVLTEAEVLNDASIRSAIEAAQAQATLRTSKYRASKEYRHEMIAVLLTRVLNKIKQRV